MIGTVGVVPKRTGGYIIPKIDINGVSHQMTIDIPMRSRILCTNCTIVNEETLITSGDISKTDLGYYIHKDLKNLVIQRYTSNMSPLTIMNAREILYADIIERVVDSVTTKIVCNLPIGTRINQVPVNQNGEITIDYKDNILIEY